MAGKPRADWKLMSYEEAVRTFPDLRGEIDEDRLCVSFQFNDKDEAYCLHCDNTVKLENMKVGVLVFAKTGLPVPDGFHWGARVLTFCATDGCDGGLMDWRDTPWCTSKDYDKWVKEQAEKEN